MFLSYITFDSPFVMMSRKQVCLCFSFCACVSGVSHACAVLELCDWCRDVGSLMAGLAKWTRSLWVVSGVSKGSNSGGWYTKCVVHEIY
jgi:hypothetical protein